MAMYCLDCIHKICGRTYDAKEMIFAKSLYLCEGCGKLKRVVLMTKRAYRQRNLRLFALPFYLLWRLLILPYSIVKTPPPFIGKRHNTDKD